MLSVSPNYKEIYGWTIHTETQQINTLLIAFAFIYPQSISNACLKALRCIQ